MTPADRASRQDVGIHRGLFAVNVDRKEPPFRTRTTVFAIEEFLWAYSSAQGPFEMVLRIAQKASISRRLKVWGLLNLIQRGTKPFEGAPT
jgi:hypothetical protein